MNRRQAIATAVKGVALCSTLKWSPLSFGASRAPKRPALSDRKFVSDAVEAKIAAVKTAVGADTELAWLFENCFPNTLDTTVRHGTLDGKPDTFVITGDIPAMWLRDSTAQVWPYLPLTNKDKKLQTLIAGVIHRQAHCILIDPYANAFNFAREGSEWEHDATAMKPELHERKWEIDSLCYPIRLAHGYWKTTADVSPFEDRWREAMRAIIKTFREQQRFNGPGPYSFQRNTLTPTDTLGLDGLGNPVKPSGLIASGFRPSDDACIFPFLIPSNLFAASVLKSLAELAAALNDADLSKQANTLSDEVSAAIRQHAIVNHPGYGQIYAYEVDGYGSRVLMDDANVPSLLGLPYLGCVSADDHIYQNTRRFVLSPDNPYFFRGKAAAGIGGPHVGLDMIWPLAIIVRGLTSNDEKEIEACLTTLLRTHAGTGFMHESFHKDDPAKFTREWFAWANTLFGELVLKVMSERPAVLKQFA